MTPVRVVQANGKYKLETLMGKPIGPRLWGAVPPNGLPSIEDEFDTKDAARDAAELWNMYAVWCQDRSGKNKKKWSRRN
jgi:hypothetical protein